MTAWARGRQRRHREPRVYEFSIAQHAHEFIQVDCRRRLLVDSHIAGEHLPVSTASSIAAACTSAPADTAASMGYGSGLADVHPIAVWLERKGAHTKTPRPDTCPPGAVPPTFSPAA